MIIAYNHGVEERLTEWANANQQQQLGRDIRAAVYEIQRLKRLQIIDVSKGNTWPR